jgi:APA family basic amino acid/polyamine antiporter
MMLAWTLGGVYALLGANYLAELAKMIPQAGEFYVFAERAFGRYGGFVVGLIPEGQAATVPETAVPAVS